MELFGQQLRRQLIQGHEFDGQGSVTVVTDAYNGLVGCNGLVGRLWVCMFVRENRWIDRSMYVSMYLCHVCMYLAVWKPSDMSIFSQMGRKSGRIIAQERNKA